MKTSKEDYKNWEQKLKEQLISRMIDSFTVILIAGGVSKRMWPLGDKCFLPFLDTSLLLHSLNQYKRLGVKKVVIVGNSRNINSVREVISRFPAMSLSSIEQKGHGMAGALLSAMPLLSTRSALVACPHDIIDDGAIAAVLTATRNKVDGAILGKKVRRYFPGGYIVSEDGIIKKIVEKPGEGNQPSSYVNIVSHYFKDVSAFAKIMKSVTQEQDDVYEKALTKMIAAGARFTLVAYDGPWVYLKYPWHVLEVMNYFLNQIKKPQIAKTARIDSSVRINGPVVIAENAVIYHQSIIIGPSFIGAGTIVGNNSLVRNSHLGNQCVVGFNTEVVRSYVGDEVWFHSNYVGDSVIGNNVAMGSGAVTANIRLDEQQVRSLVGKDLLAIGQTKLGAIIGNDVRIGVNASIMPGIKIGRGSFVGAGVILTRDLADDMLVTVEQKINIAKNKKSVKTSERKKFRKAATLNG